jgi:hypothetical protein
MLSDFTAHNGGAAAAFAAVAAADAPTPSTD